MKKFLLACTLLLSAVASHAQMSDTQVMQYVQREMKSGASQAQIATRLMQRGVTMQQLQRIRSQYETLNGGRSSRSSGSDTDVLVADSRLRDNNGSIRTDSAGNALYTQIVKATSAGTENAERAKVHIASGSNTIHGKAVFGRDIFNQKALSFEPNMNIATPATYIVGPGDKVFVDVYGASQKSEQLEVSPDGTIMVTGYGPIHIGGLSVDAANAKIRRVLGQRYSSSEIRMTVGQTRTISVNVMGEVMAPGTYTLSAFASVFHALYMAGGVNSLGTLRNIKVFRGGRQITSVDIYDYILNGKLTGNVRLADNDVIMVGPYDCIVDIAGNVKRPMAYEMKKNESVATLLKYSGGFSTGAYQKAVRLNRVSGDKFSAYNIPEFEMADFKLLDGDSVTVDTILRRYENTVEVRGAVYHPGQYDLGGTTTTVRSLIENAGGLTEEAFTSRAVLHRMKSDRTWRVLSVDVEGIMEGRVADIPLRNEDVLYVASLKEMQDDQTLTIHGEVQYPGVYRYAENETLEDFILQAGGLNNSASVVKVDVARRIIDNHATTSQDTIAHTYSFALKEGFVIDGEPGFHLMPYDEVYVRKSPGYTEQQNVKVEGEVLFEGTYTLSKKSERLSEIIKKAGGLTKTAYAKGARLVRTRTPEEQMRDENLQKMAIRQKNSEGKDTLDLSKLDIGTTYPVGIELDQALAHPGSDADVVVREGDRIIVPEYSGTVKINGEVMYPNTVNFIEGKSLDYYINQAGGYSQNAKKKQTYIIYMNGNVTRPDRKHKPQPGCEIIVPTKVKGNRMSTTEMLAIGTSTASIATMIATMVNLFK